VSKKDYKGFQKSVQFAFEANSWDSCIGSPMMLKKVFRQKDQSMFFVFLSVSFGQQHIVVAFARMLNEMRYGKLQESTIRIFKTLDRELIYTDGIQPTDM